MKNNLLDIPVLSSADSHFTRQLEGRLDRRMLVDSKVTNAVAEILAAVRSRGDAAVLEYTKKFDHRDAGSLKDLVISRDQLQMALDRLPESDSVALRHAAERIRAYHEKQKQSSWHYQEADGSVYGQKILPLEKVGIYVPGGKASYPSSMLMLGIPAQVAGVQNITATVPTAFDPDNAGSNLVCAAAALAGVSQMITIGGAQAIAAMAYGTETIQRVDKITGPGNIYVTVAKRMVFGEVGIDMVAGPSELTVICDGGTNPDWIAMDLFSQAEHDEQAQSILISPDRKYLELVLASINKLLPAMERQEIIRASMENRGMLIHVASLDEAVQISNSIAPEHLELSVADPESLLAKVENAGAVFLGRFTAEALGDYCAGPSHVLPTSGTARFFSALGVYDFQKRSSIISCSPVGAHRLVRTAATLARRESLTAHAKSAEYRLQDLD
ncbi:MAG: histidinol dehydrogenase [Pseudohongiellaceae bacterium]